MNYFLKYRYALWSVIILSVIVLTAVCTMFYLRLSNKHQRFEKGDENKRHAQMEHFFRNELGFSPEQEKKAIEFRGETFKTMHALFDSLEHNRIAIIAELAKPQPDTVLLYRLSNENGTLHAKLRYLSVKQILKLRSICTPEQAQKLNKLNEQIKRPEGPPHRPAQGKDDPNHKQKRPD
jgi:Spy/CpxP family protein refolding chaperone